MTVRALMRWKINPAHLQDELDLQDILYKEMDALKPQGLFYNTYRLEDGVTFIAVAEMRDGLGVLAGIPSFGRYRGTLDERCDESPSVTVLEPVGLYSSR